MFGYINANLGQLSEEELATYKAFYCGLCRRLKEYGGARTQMLLNYDMAFLVILLSGLYEPRIEEGTFSCRMHPGKKMHSLLDAATDYAAAMDILLGYHNLMDDYQDTGDPAKKAAARLLRPSYDIAASRWPRQADAIEDALRRLSEAEQRNETDIDGVAGLTGDMLSAVFCWKDDALFERDLSRMGQYMGRFIYLMDAYEDRKKDERKHCYNPLIGLYARLDDEDAYEAVVLGMLQTMMAQAAAAFERLPVVSYAGILRNILYSGVWTRYEKLQHKAAGRAGLHGPDES